MPYTCTLSKELQAKAKKELNEKPEWRARDIDTLRQMILSNKGLKCRTDDEFLLRFLRARKFNYDKAYELLVNYFTIRAKTPDVFTNFCPSAVEKALDEKLVMILPHRDQDGRRIMYERTGSWDPDKVSIYDVMKVENMMLEMVGAEEETQVNGIVWIGDFGGYSLKQAKHLDAKTTKLMSSILQDGFPLRFKGSHIVHEPTLFTTLWAVLKPFLKEKMLSRVTVHGNDHASLHKQISPDLLPKELGGKLGPADDIATKFNIEFRASSSLFDGMENQSIELMKEIHKKEKDTAEEAVTGTFRKLNVD